MTNIRCIRCGVVNLVADEVCKVCGVELQTSIPQHVPGALPFAPQTAPPSTSIVRPFITPGDAIGPTISLFGKNIWLITKIVFVIFAPFEVFKTLSVGQAAVDWQLSGALFVMDRMCDVFVAPALFYALLKVMETGTAPGVNEAYRWGLSKIPKLALTGFLVWILTTLGFLFFIIPGILLTLSFTVTYPVTVFEKVSGSKALRRSDLLTRGRRWNILGAIVVIGILAIIVNISIAVLGGLAGSLLAGPDTVFIFSGGGFWPLEAATAILADIFGEVMTVLSLVIYLGILRTLESAQSVIE